MTHPEPTIRSIPLSRLELAPENVRKTPADPAAFAELKASIAAHGLLENLIVRVRGSQAVTPDQVRGRLRASTAPWSPADAASPP